MTIDSIYYVHNKTFHKFSCSDFYVKVLETIQGEQWKLSPSDEPKYIECHKFGMARNEKCIQKMDEYVAYWELGLNFDYVCYIPWSFMSELSHPRRNIVIINVPTGILPFTHPLHKFQHVSKYMRIAYFLNSHI